MPIIIDGLDERTTIAHILTMLLAIDIGNTDTVIGVFEGDKLTSHFRVASALNLTVDECGLFVLSLFNHHIKMEHSQVDRIAICSVVPHLTEIYEKMALQYFEVTPLVINHKIKLPFKIDYPNPSEIGADRLANSAAGFSLIKKAVIIVDLGTATTFDIVSENGDYIGGVIAPGPQTAGANLALKAAKLFEVRIEPPDRIIGKTTAEAIKSGLFYGTVGTIDYLIELIFNDLGQKSAVIATGGQAEIFAEKSKYISQVIPTLTLQGIKQLADYNC